MTVYVHHVTFCNFFKFGCKYPLDDFLSIQLRRAGLNVVYVKSIMA